MKHTSALPGRMAIANCGVCGAALPIALLRLVRKDPPAFKCTNAAACRKRQRQRAATEPKP